MISSLAEIRAPFSFPLAKPGTSPRLNKHREVDANNGRSPTFPIGQIWGGENFGIAVSWGRLVRPW